MGGPVRAVGAIMVNGRLEIREAYCRMQAAWNEACALGAVADGQIPVHRIGDGGVAAISIAAPAADLSMTPIYRSAPAAVPVELVIASNRAVQYLQTCGHDDQTEGCPGHAQTDRLAVVRGAPDGVFFY